LAGPAARVSGLHESDDCLNAQRDKDWQSSSKGRHETRAGANRQTDCRRCTTSKTKSTATSLGQALAYKIGKLKIKELQSQAEWKLGNKFNIREFHDIVLSNGAVTLDVLEFIVQTWIFEKKKS